MAAFKDLLKGTIASKDKPANIKRIAGIRSTITPIASIGSTRRVKKSFLERMADYDSGKHVAKQYIQTGAETDPKNPDKVKQPKKESITDKVKEEVKKRALAMDNSKGVVDTKGNKEPVAAESKPKDNIISTGLSYFADLFSSNK